MSPQTSWRRSFALIMLLFVSQARSEPQTSFCTVVVRPGESLRAAVVRAASRATELFLPPGEYEVKEPITLPSGRRLVGSGPATVLRAAPELNALGVFVLEKVSDAAVRNLTIDGRAAKNKKLDGIRGTSLVRFTFEGVRFLNIPSRAINLWGASRHGVIRRCTVVAAGDRGIVLGAAAHCRVESCEVRECGAHGIWVLAGSRFVTAAHNDCHDNRGQGIEVFKGCEACTLAFNRCARNSLGIHCHTVRRSLLLGNVVERNRSNGIDCNNCEQMRIIGNHSEYNGSPRTPQNPAEGSGILLYRSRDCLVVGNVSIDNDQGHSLRSGIQLMDDGDPKHLCTRNVVVGNVCFDDQEKPTQEVGMRIGRPQSKCPDNLAVANSLGRHPRGPFGGNRRGALFAAHNWTGAFAQAHGPVPPRLPVVKKLPKPTDAWRGRVVLLAADSSDAPYLCRRRNGKLIWARIER